MAGGIGFGKAGNNPWQWLALGGAGLQSMMANSPTNDPEDLQNQQFLRAAVDTGKPQTSIPREVHGLLPMLAQKIGLISPNIQASQDQMHMENLAIAAKHQEDQQRRLTEIDHMLSVITNATKLSPELGAAYYKMMPEDMRMPGISPEDIAKIKTVPEENLAAKQANEQQREADRQIALEQGQQRIEQGQERLDQSLAKGGSGAEDKTRKRNQDTLFKVIATYRSQAGSDPMQADVLNKKINTLMPYAVAGEDPTMALQAAEAAGVEPPAPMPLGGPLEGLKANLEGLKAMLSRVFGASPAMGTGPSGAPPTTPQALATPNVVRPSW